jgi:alkylated DNA repair protein (DNA oxidative demethylase)
MTLDLFGQQRHGECEAMGSSAFVLRGFALPHVDGFIEAIRDIQAAAPFRHMVTRGGFTMSVALTNCGELGWTSDRRGYRYTGTDPQSGQSWPAMPVLFDRLAQDASHAAGFGDFKPDACLINRYEPGARLSLHQDRNERDFAFPVVAVSLGMSATFLFGGHERTDRTVKLPLHHGDVVVWGREDRLRYHGVMPLEDDPHPVLGSRRISFTFRKAG